MAVDDRLPQFSVGVVFRSDCLTDMQFVVCRVIEFLRDAEMVNGRTDEEWAQLLDCSPARVRQAIDNLLALGLIREIEPHSKDVVHD